MPNVILRDLTEADRERLHIWRNSPDVAAYMYTDHQISRAEHDGWFDGLAGDLRRRYWIIELDGQPVGLANLADIDLRNSRCAWAYYLAEPSVRGLGVGSYIEFWMIEHVFGTLGLNKLCCEVLASNTPVWQLHLTYGFTREALYRQHILKAGQYEDVIGLGLLASDWPALKPAMQARLQAKGFQVT